MKSFELCDPRIGCHNIQSGTEDVGLCNTLFTCMTETKCGASDPLFCLCGTASGSACFTGAAGPCRDQVMAATKAPDFTEAGKRFYDFAFPSGFATQRIACWKDFCGPAAPDPHTGVCPAVTP